MSIKLVLRSQTALAAFLGRNPNQNSTKVQVCPNMKICSFLGCQKPFTSTRQGRRFCSARCRSAASYFPKKKQVQERKNVKFASIHRDCSLDFYGRYGGSKNSCSVVGPSVLTEQQLLCLSKTRRGS